MSPAEALDALFRENELPMSDRNGVLYDTLCAALAEAPKPYAYLVVQASGFIVGAWRDRETAEAIAAKQLARDAETVVPVVLVGDADDLVATAVIDVRGELQRAIEKFPTWPTDPIHALAVLGEEFGELTQAVLQLTYEPHKSSPDQVHREAIQTAAMALRFAMSLHRYEYQRGAQHVQHEAPGEAA